VTGGSAVAAPGGASSRPWPRISIVTPCLNAVEHLDDALTSVLSQGYPNLEYVVIDGGSSDGSVDLIRKYADRLAAWVSEPDRGHAHALNKGFERTSGEIMGWINADDILHPGALRLLARLFGDFPEVEWLTGQASHLDEAGSVVSVNAAQVWTRLAFLSGDYRWIQQESTYWRRGLWERAGGRISEERELACDFELWVRFFRHAPLFSAQGLIGAFRYHEGSRSRRRIDDYEREAREIVFEELPRLLEEGLPSAGIDTLARPLPLLEFDWRTMSYRRCGS
jgi:glycosyltransferase involved in cell wall biosynthesis